MRENLLSVSTFGVEGGAFTAGRGLIGRLPFGSHIVQLQPRFVFYRVEIISQLKRYQLLSSGTYCNIPL